MAEYSSDELNPPKWINHDFFDKILAEYNNDASISVKNVVTSPGTKPGEHYASCMYRAEVTFDSKTSKNTVIKLIIKTIPEEAGTKLEMLNESTAFKTEMKMYGDILPEMHRLLRSINDETQIAPRLVHQSNEPAPVLVFIDEGPNGFKPFKKPLDLERAKVLCERIAKFHACSIFMNENGKDLTVMQDCPYVRADGRMNFLSFFVNQNMKGALKSVKEWEGCEEMVAVMEKNLPIFDQRIENLFKSQSKLPYQLLVHGDFGFHNMMFRNEGLKSEDFLLIDYQFCYWNTPAMDILSLLYAGVNYECRTVHRQEIIQEYFICLTKTLKNLNYKGKYPKLLELQMEILRCGLIEYMFLMVFVPFQYIDMSKLDITEMMEDRDMHKATKEVYKNEEYQEMFKNRVKYLIEMGVFD